MQLYKINEVIETVLNQGCFIDTETGELFEKEDLDKLDMEKSEKVLNLIKFIKNLKAEYTAIENEKKNLESRAKHLKNREKLLKKYLCDNATGEKFKDAQAELSWRKSKSVEFDSDVDYDDKYYIITKELSKTLLRKDLEQGLNIKGAYIKESMNPQIK